MIVYFSDRKLNIIGQASTGLPKGLTIVDDLREEDVETGVATFECVIGFDDSTRSLVERCATPGNYILRCDGGENEFYTITETEIDTKSKEVTVYAEDAGLDLLNEIVVEYEADKAYPISHYIEKFAYDSGFEIGTNEVASLTRKLSWDGESTITERIASIATQFDGAEVSYSFEVKGMQVIKKFINIHKKRGKDIGVTLRLNNDIDRIITTKSILNLATALLCTGGTPEGGSNPINLSGYTYDDGDFFTDGRWLKSRKALEAWNRYTLGNGWIVRPFEYDTTDQKTLCTKAIAELKKAREMEVNYEVEISKLPDNARIGDRVNIVDDLGGLYVSARILKLKSSVVNQDHTATIGEYLIKDSGISQKVADLAAKFAQTAQSASHALAVAKAASTTATAAKEQANTALADSVKAQQAATDAATASTNALALSIAARDQANHAQAAVDSVEKSVAGIVTTVANAQAAAEQARQAAETAETKATEAHTASVNAETKATEAATAAQEAKAKATEATEKADTVKGTADQAKAEAEAAATTAAAAKLDAENAKKDIASLGENLTTLSNTMTADYARKTDLTEAEAHLQSQITQNAGLISSTVSMLSKIDETANDAEDQAEKAQKRAEEAQRQAAQAIADAEAAQLAANEAAQLAEEAQAEADTAREAAETAQSVLDNAQAALDVAISDLETVESRADATEAEIAAARQAVEAAQTAANAAKVNADAAAKTAAEAQETASTATYSANEAQAVANAAANHAKIAQSVAADSTNAAAAQSKANEAAQTAATAQETANTAKANAENAKAQADQAATDAANAQKAAEDAEAKAAQAETDLATAQQNLADVTSRVDATEEEVAAAQLAVQTAQSAANKAKEDAATAQTAADQAKADATAAQTVATNAKTAADNAQAAADDAQAAADAAQDAVNALAVRVTTAETQITQNAEQIQLRATKEEITQTLAGYATTAEMEAAIAVKADEINLSVDSKIDSLPVSGRNLLLDSMRFVSTGDYIAADYYFGTVTPVVGKTYTIRLKGNLGADYTCFRLYGTNAFLCDLSTDGDGYYSATFVWGSNNAGSTYVRVYNVPSANTTISTIEWIKLEEGIRGTDWTPAPEETEVKVGARNYILDSAAEIASSLTGSTVYLDLTYPAELKENTAEEFIVSFDAMYESEADVLQFGFYFRGSGGSITQRNPEWISMTNEYKRYSYVFKYKEGKGSKDITGVRFAFRGGTGTAYVRSIKLEAGSKATDWTPAPEDHANANDVADQFKSVTESVADLQVKAGEINASVADVKKDLNDSFSSINGSITKLSNEVSAKMTPKAVEVKISEAMQKGTEKVVTSTGYRFDEEGLTVEKSGSEMKTQITDNGMTVYQNGESVLEANNNGVDAKNLHATTYLIVGENSRFEDYGNGRTGCFWIGG